MSSFILLILLFGAVFGVMLLQTLKLPSILGYLLAGIILGPHAFNSLENTEILHTIGEFGIVFLMFSIGLEFSLPQLKSTPKKIVLGAIIQIILSMLLSIPVVWAIAFYYKGEFVLSWQSYVVFAAVFAMSSTAIVSKVLSEKLQMSTPHGKVIIYTLLFQDLAIIPFLVLIPSLQDTTQSIYTLVAMVAIKITLILILVLKAGEPIIKKWIDIVAAKKSQELFMLNIFLIVIGLASLTEFLHLSMPLGAFLAGLIISETKYKINIEEDIKPFKDVLLGLFFITIGSTLNFADLFNTWQLVLCLLIVIVVVKAIFISFAFNILHKNISLAIKSALGLAHAGEFGFLLIRQSYSGWFGDDSIQQALTVAIILSMLVTPFLLQYSHIIALKFSKNEWLTQSLNITKVATHNMRLSKHIIITGFSHFGQNLANLCNNNHLNFVSIDFNPYIVNSFQEIFTLIYGDAGRKEILLHAGIVRAKTLVLTHNDVESYIKIQHYCAILAPNIKIIARVDDIDKQQRLIQEGFTNIICDSLEGISKLHIELMSK